MIQKRQYYSLKRQSTQGPIMFSMNTHLTSKEEVLKTKEVMFEEMDAEILKDAEYTDEVL